MSGDALEQALALQRAPFLRRTLRTRPLPDDIGSLIQIASGSPALLAEAARSSGETEAHVLEAVRFLLQEALFFPDADAYRVLGVQPNAPASRIREHYRWLQRWLHPDRRDGEWETIFATRVNAAWGQVRTAEARSRYDAFRLRGQGPGFVAMAPGRLRMSKLERPGPGRSRWLALGAVSGCLLLAIALVRREDRPPDWSGLLPNASVAAKDDAPKPKPKPKPEPVSTRRGTVSGKRPGLLAAAQDHRATALRPVAAATAVDGRMPNNPTPQTPVIRIPPPAIAAAPTPMVRSAQPAPSPAPQSMPVSPTSAVIANPPVRPVSIAVAPSADPELATVAAPDTTRVDPLHRMQLAGNRTRQVVRYLGDPAARTPPIWNDVRSQLRAERDQQALQARLGNAGRMTLELQDPQWRLGERDARLLTGYRVVGHRGKAETGLLTLGLTWREGMWLVHEISLEPSS